MTEPEPSSPYAPPKAPLNNRTAVPGAARGFLIGAVVQLGFAAGFLIYAAVVPPPSLSLLGLVFAFLGARSLIAHRKRAALTLAAKQSETMAGADAGKKQRFTTSSDRRPTL